MKNTRSFWHAGRAILLRCTWLLVVLGSFACSRQERPPLPSAPESGGTLRVAVLEPLDFLTPVLPIRPLTEAFLQHVTPPLGRVNELGRVEFVSARGWRDLDTRLDFILRPIRWQDGQPVSASDFVLTSEVMLHPGTRGNQRSRFDLVEELVAINDSVLTFRFLDLRPTRFRDALLMPLPRHVLGDAPNARDLGRWPITQQPLSCGPFRVVEASTWSLTLERNDDSGFPAPWLDRVEVQTLEVPDALRAFRDGRLDVIDNLGAESIEALVDVREKRIVALVGRSYVFMAWNLRDGRFSDPNVRRAAALAVDVRRLIADLTLAQGDIARGPLVPALGIRDTTAVLEYDPDSARRLLDQAGWRDHDGDGVRERRGKRLAFQILVQAGDPLRRGAAEGIARDLQAIGMRCELRELSPEVFVQRLESRAFEAFMGQWFPEMGLGLDAVWRSGEQRFNYGGYVNASVDSLLSRLQYERPEPWRQADLVRLQQEIYGDQPYLFLFQPPRFVVFSSRVQGARPNLLSPFWNLPEWWIPAALQTTASR